MKPRLLDRLLAASGARVKGATLQTWLKLAATRPEPNVTWWIFQDVAEPAAIPVLRHLAFEKNQRDVVERYERSIISYMGQQYTQCCDSTEICLRKRVVAANALRISTQRIDSEKDLARWLSGTAWIAAMNTDSITLRFDNAALNIAEVRTFDNSIQQWRHLFGCWIKTAKAE